jgi:signal transduction histidine kinase
LGKISSGNVWKGEFINRKKTGELYYESAVISALSDNEGRITHYIAVKEDITERKSLEKALKEFETELIIAKEKAEESDKLKTAFLNNLSHEIRTPMNGIIGFSEMYLYPDLNDERRNYYANIVISEAKKLLSIINDIIKVSEIEVISKNKKDHFNLNDCIREVFANMQQSDEKTLTYILELGLSDNQSYIISCKEQLSLVLRYLLSNAIKFTHEGSITIGYAKIENQLQFFVEDTGIGIEEKYQKTIFEPFRQVNLSLSKPYGGNGIGLTIAKKIVHYMGGEIWVNSVPEKGTTVFFTLPYHKDE